MIFLEEIVEIYNYIKKIENENKDLKMQLNNTRKSYSKLNKEVIKLKLQNEKLKEEK